LIGQQLNRCGAMPKKSRKRRRVRSAPDQEATYVCDSCGEEIVVPVDLSAGAHQDYVEDCPVCCHPMILHVDIDSDGEAHVAGEHE
jgi:transcription elongation factor Elf1